ncbi:MAG: hypothetical protein ABI977_30870 [Acidobacteriota bacterium]
MILAFLRGALCALAILCLLNLSTYAMSASTGDALYFSFQPSSALPSAPSSLLVQSSNYVNVPAGAVLSVRLMRGNQVVSTSTLSFSQAYTNTSLLPPVPVALFAPPGQFPSMGQPLPGATLTTGTADLMAVASAPDQYRLWWELSSGVMGTPGRAIVTGDTGAFVDLKLSGVSAAAIIGDQKPGSVLFYNRYTSNPTSPLREDTALNLTNTHPTDTVNVRIFFVSGATCQTEESVLCLTPRQSVSLLASDIDPGSRGYVIAIACDAAGQPTQFNWLVGNAVTRQPNVSGSYSATLSALAVAKRTGGAVVASGGNAEMVFDDAMYDRLPGQLMIDNVPSQGGLNASAITFYRPLANLAGGNSNAAVQVSGWSDAQGQTVNSSGTVSTACYGEVNVSALRLSPIQVSQLIPAGSNAWFALSTADLQPLLGAQLNSGPFSSGSTARALVFSAEYRIRVPVVPVTCNAASAAEER